LASYDLGYEGFGVTNFDGTPFPPNHQFAFSTPDTVREDLHVFSLRAEIPISAFVLVAGYAFEDYTLDDWQQGAEGPWVEQVGADTLVRDTSRRSSGATGCLIRHLPGPELPGAPGVRRSSLPVLNHAFRVIDTGPGARRGRARATRRCRRHASP
jgi:hypothetical protein